MPGFKLSVEAAADLEAIGEYGLKTFGFAQLASWALSLPLSGPHNIFHH
jgi:plasmid stabilization system protein ParE